MELAKDFVDTSLMTEYGDFQIRVYKDNPNKETVVLWTNDVKNKQPCLVRVHSECLTGDVMGSRKCDCGEQLKKSMQMIQEQGGVLIYLRQEGRGIGLFEKMKAYQLQAEGRDTFEANIALGHAPDPRSYEMAKVALDDLGITRVKLLTNNPSKVSELAKLGIKVTERVPIIVKSCSHNKNYLEAKKLKFSHFLDGHEEPYFYKVQVQSSDQVEELIKFLPGRILDPTLRIGVGVSACLKTFSEPEKLVRIRDIQKACSLSSQIESILHFSFKNVENPDSALDQIELHFGQFDRIQLNDLTKIDMPLIKKAAQLFKVDLALGFHEVNWLDNINTSRILQKLHAHIVLDPSRGAGVSFSADSYMQPINRLLEYGFHDITLCGGFGPDRLDTYFKLRKYYKINFSCDAETYLKSSEGFSTEKISLYLEQLLRFDDPNFSGIQQTRELLEASSTSQPTYLEISGYPFTIRPGVFNANLFPSTKWFAEQVCELTRDVLSFCEIGCGSGIISCLAALDNRNLSVVASDINSLASKNTLENARNLGLTDRLEVYTGDVFDSVPSSKKFDLIFWSLPFGFLYAGEEISKEESQVFDPGYRAIRKFIGSCSSRLNPGGQLFVGFSSELGHLNLLTDIASQKGLLLLKVKEKLIKEKESINFEIFKLSPKKGAKLAIPSKGQVKKW